MVYHRFRDSSHWLVKYKRLVTSNFSFMGRKIVALVCNLDDAIQKPSIDNI